MNFLAHLYLSGTNEEIMIGNFIGDFVKGNQLGGYSANIQLGIRLHRDIDLFTDSHPIVKESKNRIRDRFRHYAPVIIDVFYDHFLARNWLKFSKVALKKFTEDFYQTIGKYHSILPWKANAMLVFMREKNWLYNYQFIDGIDQSLKGLSKRTPFDSGMEHATESLKIHYDDLERDFFNFFPSLQHHVGQFI